jgi:hypothetical protein
VRAQQAAACLPDTSPYARTFGRGAVPLRVAFEECAVKATVGLAHARRPEEQPHHRVQNVLDAPATHHPPTINIIFLIFKNKIK